MNLKCALVKIYILGINIYRKHPFFYLFYIPISHLFLKETRDKLQLEKIKKERIHSTCKFSDINQIKIYKKHYIAFKGDFISIFLIFYYVEQMPFSKSHLLKIHFEN